MRIPALAAAAALLLLVPAGAAVAAPATSPPPGPSTLADGLVGPLHLSVGPGKTVTVSESFAGRLTAVSPSGATSTLYASPVDGAGQPEWSVGGVDHRGSTLYFVESQGAGPEDPRPLTGALRSIDRNGTVRTVTDQLGAYEDANNPDSGQSYGLSAADMAANPQCVAELGAVGFPASYTGELDSHPYAVAVVGPVALVADAGANAILAVSLRTGNIRTLAVLPPQPAVITPEAATNLGIPSCANLTYAFEPVPTDVAVGPGGKVYVSLLPGGPEDASLGVRGSVWRVNPFTGNARQYVGGLLSPTGIDVARDGTLYVASLFGEGVYSVSARHQHVSLVLPAVQAVDVEVSGSTLYATTNAFGNGSLVSLRLGGHHS